MTFYKFVIAIVWGLFFWVIGFVWGSIALMVPFLKNLKSIPYFAQYPAVSIPILILYFMLVTPVARRYLRNVANTRVAGIIFGAILALTTLLLDYLVFYDWFRITNYFYDISVWLAYLILFIKPISIGKKMSITR